MKITRTVFRRYTITVNVVRESWGGRTLNATFARTYPPIPVPAPLRAGGQTLG